MHYSMPVSSPRRRTVVTPLLVLVLGLLAIGMIAVLQSRSTASRDAQLKLATVKLELSKLQTAPFQAHASTGGSPAVAMRLIKTGKRRIEVTLATLRRDAPPAELRVVRAPLRANYTAIDRIYLLGASDAGYGREADKLGTAARADAAPPPDCSTRRAASTTTARHWRSGRRRSARRP